MPLHANEYGRRKEIQRRDSHESTLAQVALDDGVQNPDETGVSALLDVCGDRVVVLDGSQKRADVERHPSAQMDRLNAKEGIEVRALHWGLE